MKTKRILSIALSLFLILSLLPMTAFADMSGTEEGTENVSFTMSVSIADGTTAPDSYGVEYRVVDAEGNDVKESGYSSYITNAEPMRISLSGLQSDYQVKIKAYSAGLGIRLSGADVSEEGWSEGKTISLTEINGKNYNFEFFQKAGAPNPGEGGNQDPGEGGSQRSPIQIELRNGQNGTTEYKVNDEWIYLSNSQSIEGVANGATVYVRAMPNGGQEIDTTGTQFWKDGKQESIDTNELQTSEGWSFTYNEGSNYDVCIEYRGNGGDNGGSGNQSTSGEFRFKCQSQMITGGSIFYKLNNADDFEQVQVNEENNQYASLTLNEAVTSITIKFVPNEGYQLDTTRGVTLRINGDLKYQADGVYISDFTSDSGHMFNLREMIGDTEEGAGSVLNSSFELEFGFENGNPGPGPEEPGEPPHGGYTGNRVTADVTITGKADFCINDSNWIHESKKVDYTYDAAKETVDFYVSWFINEKYTSFTINGVDYLDELPTEKQDLLDACKGQLYEIRIEVPYSEKYEISATKEEVKGEDMPVGNFLWSYTNPQQKDDYIDHGHMELVSVNYGGETYSPEQLNNPGSAFDWSESAEGGSAVLPADAVVTVRLVPDYGYQLTSFGINGGEFDTHDEQSTFTFVIKGGNFHLGARFTEVEDKVASTSNAVASGSIQLGENEIDTGSVVLSVGDADLTDEQKTAFSNAGDGNYEVSTYLDINLNQVLYKGTTDEDDVWTTPLGKEKTLKSPATVTLKLDEGVDGNNVVILHETHGGDYEVIEATYDAENHTITFITDSFSNYAIASKADSENISDLQKQFEEYKRDALSKADSKKQTGDSATVTKLIETAKAAINALSYDSSKNLDGNKKNVDDILNKMAKDIAAQKITEAGFIPNEIEEKPTTGDVVNITSEVKDNSLNASLSNIPAGAITLTEEESENGAYVWLELNTVNDDSATAAAFEGKLSGYSVGAYMEIDLFKMTMDGDVTTITDTNSAVSVTVTVPDSLLNKDKDILRTFYIARNHNGNVEILGASYDANNKTLTFKTDKFSDYAIIYKDAQKNITVADNPTNVDKTVPKTGDNSNQLLWITLLMISAMCVFGICIRGKRRTQ